MKTNFLSGCALLILGASSSHAAVLAQYNFESGFGYAPNQEAASVNATDIQPNTVLTAGNAGFVLSSSSSPEGAGNLAILFSNVDDASAPTDGTAAADNITFTITSSTAAPVNLGMMTFLTRLNLTTTTGAPGGLYTVQYDDLSDVAGFQFLETFTQTSATSTTRTVDLSSSAFDNLTAGITFRINFTEPAGASPANGPTNSMKLDLLTVHDVIPEPSSLVLTLGGGFLAFIRRRPRRA